MNNREKKGAKDIVECIGKVEELLIFLQVLIIISIIVNNKLEDKK